MSQSKISIMPAALVVLHVVAGIYAGACLGIAVVDLRYVSSISDPERSIEVFSPLLTNMGQLMAPQLVIMLVLCVVFSIRALQLKKPMKTHIPLVVYLALLGVTLAFHIPINLVVMSGEISVGEIGQAIARWDFWHWIRTGLAVILPAVIIKYYRPLANARV